MDARPKVIRIAVPLLLVVSAGFAIGAQPTDPAAGPAAETLPRLTQQLMDAVTNGDPAVWQRLMSDQAVFVTEAGERIDKATLLKELRPLPPGLSGSIEVRDPQVLEFGDVAVLLFDAFEKELVYDQPIEVTYRGTSTWRREDGSWRMIASQMVVVAKDPPPLFTDTSRLGDYVGTYELSGRRRYRVERRGDSLVGGREGGSLAPLIPVGENVFTDAGSPLGIQRIFVRGKDGAVERMVERRKFADTSWLRLPAPKEGEGPKS